MLKRRPNLLNLQAIHIIDIYDCMRISHGNRCHIPDRPIHLQRIGNRRVLLTYHGDLLRAQNRRTHIYADRNGFAVLSKYIHILDAALCRNTDSVLFRNPRVIHKLGHTAHSVSAHRALRTVRVIHIHLTVRNLRRLDQDQTVRSDSEVAVTDKLRCFRRVLYRLLKTVHINVIIADTVHFRKLHNPFSPHRTYFLCYYTLETLTGKQKPFRFRA